jgi:hypothetical protein
MELKELIPAFNMPQLVDTVLLSYKDVIISDSFLFLCSVRFGPGFKKSLNEQLREIKKEKGVIKTLQRD